MVDKKLGGAGLRGQSAGETALCTVGKTGAGLTYRGYDIKELADKAQFEEVAYLLLYGKLPNQAELDAYKAKLKSLRSLPEALKVVLEQIPAPDGCDAHRLLNAGQLGNRARFLRAARSYRPHVGGFPGANQLLVQL